MALFTLLETPPIKSSMIAGAVHTTPGNLDGRSVDGFGCGGLTMTLKRWNKVGELMLVSLLGSTLIPGCDSLGLPSGEGGTGGTGGTGGADISAEALMQEDLDDAEPAGGVVCKSPSECVDKCVAEGKYCWAAHAAHPYKAGQTGDLYQCIDRFPKAKNGGSYTCLYQYPSGDACIFAYGAKFGPIHLPAPSPICVYKSN